MRKKRVNEKEGNKMCKVQGRPVDTTVAAVQLEINH